MLPADVQAALNQMQPNIRKAFEDAIAQVTSQAAVAAIEEAIRAGQYQAAVDLLRISGVTFSPLDLAVTQAYWAGGGMVAGSLTGTKDPITGVKVQLGFNGRHPRAEAWAKSRGSALVTEIANDQRLGIQTFIQESVQDGRGPRDTALDIVGRINKATGKREGGIVGLTGQAMQWVANARAELSDPETATKFLSRAARDQRFDRMIRTSAETGKPLGQADVDRIITAYSSRLLKLRGEAIARTEALNALRAGRHEAWAQAIEGGTMAASDVIVEWSSTMDARTRHSHVELDGKKVTFGGLFRSELGSLMAYPGDVTHGALAADTIQCRCMAVYRRRRRGDV